MLERINEIVAAATADLRSASSSSELEDKRVNWLGRKAELPNLLRGVKVLGAYLEELGNL